MADECRYPPPGVSDIPEEGRPILSLSEAARLLGKDKRTVQSRIVSGGIEGGATPRPQRLQWWVYLDQVVDQIVSTTERRGRSTPRAYASEVDCLRSANLMLIETNRALMGILHANRHAQASHIRAAQILNDEQEQAIETAIDTLRQALAWVGEGQSPGGL